MTRRDQSSQRSIPPPSEVWIPITLGIILRSIQVWMPITGIHSWRQADTAAMARHFHLSNTPIWLPQIDWGGASAGYVESEFPLFPYLTSQLYQLFGLHEWLGRCLSIVCSALTIWLIIRLGRRWFNPAAGWWGGMALAVAPLGIYYGRSFQAEALMLLCAAAALESHSFWSSQQSKRGLILSWLLFTTAALIKVIPLLWLGLPLLLVQLTPDPQNRAEPLRSTAHRLVNLLRRPGFWIYSGSSIAIVSAWYFHAYQLGDASGLSFGFWGEDSDRSNIGLILNLSSWLNLTLRTGVRVLSVIGMPFLIFGGIRSWPTGGGRIALGGLIGVLLCTLATMQSSTVHEYYQLPMLLFTSPLIGLGLDSWRKRRQGRLIWWFLGLWLMISMLVMSIDYWAVEVRQSRAWMPLARTIRNELPSDARIVTVTGPDPTLLNLARRQGWMISSSKVTPARIERLRRVGASHLAGSFLWEATYQAMPQADRETLRRIASSSDDGWIDENNQTYLLPLNKIAGDF